MFLVYNKPCNQCLFSKNKIVSDDRYHEIIKECLAEQRHFLCHKSTIQNKHICCHAFYKKHEKDVWYITLAKKLNMVKFVKQKMNNV